MWGRDGSSHAHSYRARGGGRARAEGHVVSGGNGFLPDVEGAGKKRLKGRHDGELVLARHEEAPVTWQEPLAAELRAAGAGDDKGVVAAAQALMNLLDKAGSRAGKHTVRVQDSQGVQTGDHNTPYNIFEASPDREST